MKKILTPALTLLLLASVLIGTSGCYRMEHVIGDGAETSQTATARQWYTLFGLVPLNDVDPSAMAGGEEDYLVVTERTFVDSLIGLITLGLAAPETVTVTQ